jgi:hypothetical protein
VFRLAVKEISRASIGLFRGRRLVLPAAGPAAQVIERHIRNDPVKPRIEAALEPEAVQIPVHPQETFLVNVASVFGPMDQVQRQSQNLTVVPVDQLLERYPVSCLRMADEPVLLRHLHRCCLARITLKRDARPHGMTSRFGLAPLQSLALGLAKPAVSGKRPFYRIRVDRRLEWPLVSTRSRHFPTIGQLAHVPSFCCYSQCQR